jgi:hypothetical protein
MEFSIDEFRDACSEFRDACIDGNLSIITNYIDNKSHLIHDDIFLLGFNIVATRRYYEIIDYFLTRNMYKLQLLSHLYKEGFQALDLLIHLITKNKLHTCANEALVHTCKYVFKVNYIIRLIDAGADNFNYIFNNLLTNICSKTEQNIRPLGIIEERNSCCRLAGYIFKKIIDDNNTVNEIIDMVLERYNVIIADVVEYDNLLLTILFENGIPYKIFANSNNEKYSY